MTLTIEVARESRLREEARRRGVPAEKLAGAMVDEALQHLEGGAPAEAEPSAEEKRRAAVQAGYGMLAGSTRTVDDFLRERHEESDREEAA